MFPAAIAQFFDIANLKAFFEFVYPFVEASSGLHTLLGLLPH